MQTVNLKKYYYELFKKDTFVEVSDEVAEALLLMYRGENNRHRKIWYEQYEKYRSVHRQYAKVKPSKREDSEQAHYAELALYMATARFLDDLKAEDETITPKEWRSKVSTLSTKKDLQYTQMKQMREEIKAMEKLKKAAEKVAREQPPVCRCKVR